MALHHGDLFDVLPTLRAASVDACVTDPPYDLTSGKRGGSGEASVNLNSPYGRARIGTGNGSGGFMGKAWDCTGVAFDPATWREVFRVLKPGAYLVAFGGTRTSHRMVCAIEDAGFQIRDSIAWLHGQGFPKNYDLGDGKGTALKPAHEPIALAWKPFKGTIQVCHETHGTAALNIDDSRLPYVNESIPDLEHWKSTSGGWKNTSTKGVVPNDNSKGRWPANVVIDEYAAAAIDEQTGVLGTCGSPKVTTHNTGMFGIGQPGKVYGDIGGASRFFYCAKPSRDERDQGCHEMAARQRDDSRKAGNPGGDNPRNRGLQPRGNFHPTVKPVDLMRWLVRLVTPVGGTVIDPFTGSGTTGCACALEGMSFIGIEREADYVEIATRRIASYAPLFQEVAQ